jgi:hypothetical protein
MGMLMSGRSPTSPWRMPGETWRRFQAGFQRSRLAGGLIEFCRPRGRVAIAWRLALLIMLAWGSVVLAWDAQRLLAAGQRRGPVG